MLHRWPLFVAAIFSVYSAVLLWNAFSSQAQLHTANEARLVAEHTRIAMVLGDAVKRQGEFVERLAESHQIQTYLINKSLGMSPRYGLNANLDAIDEIKFQTGCRVDPVVVEYDKLDEHVTKALESVDTSMSNLADDDFDLESLEVTGGDECVGRASVRRGWARRTGMARRAAGTPGAIDP